MTLPNEQTPLSPQDRADGRRLEQAATKGPWAFSLTDDGRCGGIAPAHHNHDVGEACWDWNRPDFTRCPAQDEIVTTDSGVYGPSVADAALICWLRNHASALLAADAAEAALARVQAENERLRTALELIRDTDGTGPSRYHAIRALSPQPPTPTQEGDQR